MVKVTPTKFKLDLCFVVAYKFHKIWFRQTKVREQKSILGCMDVRTSKGRTYLQKKQGQNSIWLGNNNRSMTSGIKSLYTLDSYNVDLRCL